jgi:TonB family protein
LIQKPTTSVQSAIQSLSQTPTNRRTIVTDEGNSRPKLGAPAANGQTGTQNVEVELKSDADAPDFRNYLIRILSIIRGNWHRVTPESVHLGTLRGENSIELIINRDGSIPKLVIGDSANVDALDRASVAGVSMSNPLPPLPDDFKGQQVRVTFTFKYNMPQ